MSEIDEGYNSNSSFNSEKEENFEQIRFKSITNKRNKKLSNNKKLSRTSLQAPVSFLKKFGNNKENIQPSLITRNKEKKIKKKTIRLKEEKKPDFIIEENFEEKKDKSKSIKNFSINKELIIKESIQHFNDLLNTIEHKKPLQKKINGIKIESGNLSIYKREQRHLIRRNNLIKKKKELQIKEQISNMKNPIINEVSKNIILSQGNYIPIYDRASQITNMYKLKSILNENKKKIKKMEEENKEYLKIQKYKNNKKFNQQNWNNFLINQENWYRQKNMKKKAIELMRESVELKLRHKPKIDINSQRIMNDIKKRKDIEDNIYIKLYNDYNYVNEKKEMKICNSMPSFKPLLNKGIKKNIFKENKKKNIYNNKSIEKQIESIIQKKLSSLSKARSANDFKILSENNFINELKNSYDNFNGDNFNNNIKNNSNINKRYEYNKK